MFGSVSLVTNDIAVILIEFTNFEVREPFSRKETECVGMIHGVSSYIN